MLNKEDKFCLTCKWHQDYWDEIDGVWFGDGCVCHREPEGTHRDSCSERKECPVWESQGGKMKAMLEIKGEKDVTIQPYLPKEICPTSGRLIGENLPKEYDCAIFVDCEGCFIESVKPSPTGEAYYETY